MAGGRWAAADGGTDAGAGFRRRDFTAHMERGARLAGVRLRWHSGYWIAELAARGRRCHVVGYNFPVNDAASAIMAGDKVAASVLMARDGVPHVPHRLLRPAPDEELAETAARLPVPLVVKPLSGSGGRDVHRAGSPDEALAVLRDLAGPYAALAVCPWLDVRHEYRVVTLDGRPLLAFEKRLPGPARPGEAAEWRHNLSRGALGAEVAGPGLRDALGELAARAAGSLGLRLSAVDIVDTGGGHAVIEVNSGVCLERFSRQDPGCRAAAGRVYEAAVAACFDPASEGRTADGPAADPSAPSGREGAGPSDRPR
jgi:ribosomal protein S6-L-glutamate ligase RimK-like protein